MTTCLRCAAPAMPGASLCPECVDAIQATIPDTQEGAVGEPRPGDQEDFVRLSVRDIAQLLSVVYESEAPNEVTQRLATLLMDAITPEEFEAYAR